MPSVDKSINTNTCLLGNVFVQKHLNHVSAVAIPALGINPAFDYTLYCRKRACLLCMFVPTPTFLIEVVNSGSFHWALSVFIYLRFMLAFRVQFAGDVNQKVSWQRFSRIPSFAFYSGSSIGARAALYNYVFFQSEFISH